MRENRLPVTLDYLIDRIGRCGRDQASDANDAGAGGNGQKMSPRRSTDAVMLFLELLEPFSYPFWLELEPGGSWSFPSACFYVIRNYGKVNYR